MIEEVCAQSGAVNDGLDVERGRSRPGTMPDRIRIASDPIEPAASTGASCSDLLAGDKPYA